MRTGAEGPLPTLQIAAAVLAGVVAVPAVGQAEPRCQLSDTRIDESSGVAAASWSDDVVFTHNDSGDSARFFAVDARSCATRATFTVTGAANVDWEDMARGTAPDGTPVLWLSDIGDNQAGRSSVVVYEVAEPGASRSSGSLPVRARWTLTYPDGATDAETLLVDPETGRAVVVTKDATAGRSRAYRVPPAGSGVLEPLARLDVQALPGGGLAGPAWSVTGGATNPDRTAVVLRTYLSSWLWSTAPGEPLATALARPPTPLSLPLGRQSEGISFTRNGQALWLTAEGATAPLHLVPLAPPEPNPPNRPGPQGSASTTAPPAIPAGSDEPRSRSNARSMALIVGGAALLLGALVAQLVRRRRVRRAR